MTIADSLPCLADQGIRVALPTLFQLGYVCSWVFAMIHSFRPSVRFRGGWRGSAVLLSIGLSMLLSARLIGERVDEQGYLHEPFPLIGGGSLLSLTGLGLALLLALFDGVWRLAAPGGKRNSKG